MKTDPEILRSDPTLYVPPEIVARVVRLGLWVRSDVFRECATASWRWDALAEVNALLDELYLLRARRHNARRDTEHLEDALRWVKADEDETESELLETISRLVPRRHGHNGRLESGAAYVKRLKDIRNTLRGPIPLVAVRGE